MYICSKQYRIMKHLLIAIITLLSFSALSFGQISFEAYLAEGNETVKFINHSSHNSSNPYMLFIWQLGDGAETFAGQELTHNYEGPGVYNVALIGSTKTGERDTFIKRISIPNDLQFLTQDLALKQKEIAKSLANLKTTNNREKERKF